MWLLILIAVHINDPSDIPGKIELQFDNQPTCEKILSTLKYELKFKSFKVEGKCIKQY